MLWVHRCGLLCIMGTYCKIQNIRISKYPPCPMYHCHVIGFSGHLFRFVVIFINVAMCDPVQDMENMDGS